MTPGFVWVQSSHGEKIVGAVEVGNEPGWHIGRALHENDCVPGKVNCTHGVLYLPWGGGEHSKQQYEVLTAKGNSSFDWIPSSNGQVPPRAIQGGKTSTGEDLYIGRTHHEGVLIPGKVHPSHRCLYVAYGGKEHAYKVDYEILVAKDDVWQIRDKKVINIGTGQEYSYDTSKQGYNLDGVIIEERYIEDYQKDGPDKWEFCQEDNETFKIKCTSSGSFLRAKSDNGENHIIKGNFSFLLMK